MQSLTLCPRYKYTYMEEMLGNIAGARQVFERWMQWEPDDHAWYSFIKVSQDLRGIGQGRTRFMLTLALLIGADGDEGWRAGSSSASL